MENKRKWTAYHEAGHAAALCFYEHRFNDASIKPDAQAGTLGRIDIIHQCDEKNPIDVAQQILIAFSGDAAEAKEKGTELREGSSTDYVYAYTLIQNYFNFDKGKCEECFNEYLVKAKEFINFLWASVEAVANELLEKETLLEREVLQIYKIYQP